MSFRVLSSDSEAERIVWMRALERFPSRMRDLHFEPGYVQAYARLQRGQGMCALYEWDGGGIVYPFVCRDREIRTAYGYGGPIRWGYGSVVASYFGADLTAWLQRHGIDKESGRLHPFMERQIGTVPADRQKLIVFMDLGEPPDAELRKGHAACVASAVKDGVTVGPTDDVDLFMRFYRGMLDRREAEDKWRFGRSLLDDLRAAYPEGFQILVASVDREPEVACVLLGAHATCYYHYAGSAHLPSNGAGHLLVLEAAKWARAQGYQTFHLGGGLTDDPQDGLLRFKCGFSRRRAWCYTYERRIPAMERAG